MAPNRISPGRNWDKGAGNKASKHGVKFIPDFSSYDRTMMDELGFEEAEKAEMEAEMEAEFGDGRADVPSGLNNGRADVPGGCGPTKKFSRRQDGTSGAKKNKNKKNKVFQPLSYFDRALENCRGSLYLNGSRSGNLSGRPTWTSIEKKMELFHPESFFDAYGQFYEFRQEKQDGWMGCFERRADVDVLAPADADVDSTSARIRIKVSRGFTKTTLASTPTPKLSRALVPAVECTLGDVHFGAFDKYKYESTSMSPIVVNPVKIPIRTSMDALTRSFEDLAISSKLPPNTKLAMSPTGPIDMNSWNELLTNKMTSVPASDELQDKTTSANLSSMTLLPPSAPSASTSKHWKAPPALPIPFTPTSPAMLMDTVRVTETLASSSSPASARSRQTSRPWKAPPTLTVPLIAPTTTTLIAPITPTGTVPVGVKRNRLPPDRGRKWSQTFPFTPASLVMITDTAKVTKNATSSSLPALSGPLTLWKAPPALTVPLTPALTAQVTTTSTAPITPTGPIPVTAKRNRLPSDKGQKWSAQALVKKRILSYLRLIYKTLPILLLIGSSPGPPMVSTMLGPFTTQCYERPGLIQVMQQSIRTKWEQPPNASPRPPECAYLMNPGSRNERRPTAEWKSQSHWKSDHLEEHKKMFVMTHLRGQRAFLISNYASTLPPMHITSQHKKMQKISDRQQDPHGSDKEAANHLIITHPHTHSFQFSTSNCNVTVFNFVYVRQEKSIARKTILCPDASPDTLS